MRFLLFRRLKKKYIFVHNEIGIMFRYKLYFSVTNIPVMFVITSLNSLIIKCNIRNKYCENFLGLLWNMTKII